MNKVANLNKKDKKRKNVLKGNILTIELYPIGAFSFDSNKLKKFFEILEIDNDKLIMQLKNMFEFAIPKLNLFKVKIEKEGFLNGLYEYEGINSWKLVYQRRKKFYENEIIKVDLKFGNEER